MTFSICVRERFAGDDGIDQYRYGVAVTTRLPGVGTLCPFVSENGAVATQSLVNVDLGADGIRYLDDGLAVEDALGALLAADDGADSRQLHGVDATARFAFSGEKCKDWFGHLEGENYTVAGNLLTGESVIEAVAESYEASDEDRLLAERLLEALEAGYEEGGDKREELPVQSAALAVRTTNSQSRAPAYNDLRVDATETPIEDLRETLDLAIQGHEDALARYEDAYESDSFE